MSIAHESSPLAVRMRHWPGPKAVIPTRQISCRWTPGRPGMVSRTGTTSTESAGAWDILRSCQERRQNRSKVDQKLSAYSWNFMTLESAGLIHAQLILTAYNGVLQQEYEVLWSHTSSPTDFESRAVVCCRPFRSWPQIWIVDNITVIGAGYWYAHPTLYNWHVLACFALGCWWMLPVF